LTLIWIFELELSNDCFGRPLHLRFSWPSASEKLVVPFFRQKQGPVGNFPLSRLLWKSSTVYYKVAFFDRSLWVVEGAESVPVATTHHVHAIGRRTQGVDLKLANRYGGEDELNGEVTVRPRLLKLAPDAPGNLRIFGLLSSA
jgi:hypothetical protein